MASLFALIALLLTGGFNQPPQTHTLTTPSTTIQPFDTTGGMSGDNNGNQPGN